MSARWSTADIHRLRRSPADRTPVLVEAAVVVDDWPPAWGVRLPWAGDRVFWFPRVFCEPVGPGFTVPTWFAEQIALKVNCS